MSIIDARIPLGVTPMQLESPTDQMGKALRLRASHDQMRKGQMEQETYERGLQEEQALRSLFGSGQPLRDQDVFAVVGPQRGAVIMKGLADLQTSQIKNETDLRTVVGSAMGAVKALPENLRGDAYKTVRQSFIQKGWIKPEQAPETYTPELLDQLQQWAMTPVQQSEHADRVADNARLDQVQADKRPGVQAASTAQVQATLASQFQGAPDQAAWDVIYAKATEAGLGHLFHPKMSRAAIAKAQHAGMKAEQVLASQVAQQNANTSAASAGETARHNKFMREREKTGSYQWALDPRDGKVRLMSPDEIRKVDAGQAPTADMRNKESARPAVQRGITAIRELGKEIFTKVGPAQRAQAIKRGAEAVFGNDPVFRTYQDARMATAGALAVEQQGARVSDADVKALWLPMVPDAYRDTKESNDLKWELIDALRGANAPKAAPSDVSDALKDKGAGRHTLSNGEVWEKDAAGNLRKVQ